MLKEEHRASSPCSTSVEDVHVGDSNFLLLYAISTNDCKTAPSIDFEVTNKVQQIDKLTNKQFTK